MSFTFREKARTMISPSTRFVFAALSDRPQAAQFAGLMHDAYADMVDEKVPNRLASLIRRLEEAVGGSGVQTRSAERRMVRSL